MKVHKTFLLSVLSFLHAGYQAIAQADTLSAKIKILPVPALGFSPETKFYAGAVCLFTLNYPYDSLRRASNAKIELNFTANKQLVIDSDWSFFSKNETYFSRGKIHYSKYPDLYFGIGASTKWANKTWFNSNRVRLKFELLKKIKPKTFVGLSTTYNQYYNVNSNSNQFAELKSGHVLGSELVFLKDTRNSLLTPVNGKYFELRSGGFLGTSAFVKIILDYRRYHKTANNIIAYRLYNSLITSTPPFFETSYLGGDLYTRGYYLGRYRDHNFCTIQFEDRFFPYNFLGIAVFGGISNVYNNDFNIVKGRLKPNLGSGIRIRVDKKENTFFRFDVAFGIQQQLGFYIGFGESF